MDCMFLGIHRSGESQKCILRALCVLRGFKPWLLWEYT
jgi:hypothetical protein